MRQDAVVKLLMDAFNLLKVDSNSMVHFVFIALMLGVECVVERASYEHDALNQRTAEHQHLDEHPRLGTANRDTVPGHEPGATPEGDTGTLTWRWTYDANGNPETYVDSKGQAGQAGGGDEGGPPPHLRLRREGQPAECDGLGGGGHGVRAGNRLAIQVVRGLLNPALPGTTPVFPGSPPGARPARV